MAQVSDSKTFVNYDKVYEHPDLPFKIKFVRTLEPSRQTQELKSLYIPSKLLEIYGCLDSITKETPLLHEWLQRNGYDFPVVIAFCDKMWKSSYVADISDPRRRVLAVVYSIVETQFDDIFEKLCELNKSFLIDVYARIISVFTTLEFEPMTIEDFGGQIDKKTIGKINFYIRLFHKIATDAVDCFSPVAHKMFLDACVASFEAYSDCEYPIRVLAREEKRYLTLEEWVEVRRLSLGVTKMIPFLYDEKQVFNIDINRYSQYSSVIAHANQYCALCNDIFSFPKEMRDFEPTNMVQKFMADQNLNLNDATDEVIRLIDKLVNATEFLYDLTPRDQKGIFLACWRFNASAIDVEVTSPRYGWKIVNATM